MDEERLVQLYEGASTQTTVKAFIKDRHVFVTMRTFGPRVPEDRTFVLALPPKDAEHLGIILCDLARQARQEVQAKVQATNEPLITEVQISISQNTPGEPETQGYAADTPEARMVLLAAIEAALNTYTEWYSRRYPDSSPYI